MAENLDGATHIGSLFAKYDLSKKKPLNERAELVRYFFEHAKKGWLATRPLKPAYIASRLAHLSIFDLHAFKSQCEDRARRGYPWGKYFWGSLKVKKS